MFKGIENSIVFYHLLDTTRLLILINIDFIHLRMLIRKYFANIDVISYK